MTKAELESKSLSELHSLAAGAGVERYRMLPRPELVAKLAGGDPGQGSSPSRQGSSPSPRSGSGSEQRERPPRRRRSRGGRKPASGAERSGQESGREPRPRPEPASEPPPAPEPAAATPPAASASPAEPAARPRRRRRRRFGRRGKQGISLQDLLLPPAAGRQAIVCAETREGCTALLRGIASDLAGDSKGPDPVVLLIDPGPEELADWRREAPQAEIVAAGQARHASDALAQATTRAGNGDDVILLVDSLTRLSEAYGDVEAAKGFFDAGRVQGSSGGGSLTVVVALERPAQS
jgi:transcription termination factor Rho